MGISIPTRPRPAPVTESARDRVGAGLWLKKETLLESGGRGAIVTPKEWPFNHNRPPLFFVSVASKELSPTVSLLFATLAGRSISVAARGLTRADCWLEVNWEGWKDFGGVRRTARRATMIEGARNLRAQIQNQL